MTSSGEFDPESLLLSWGLLLLFSAIYVLISRWLFLRMLDKARRDATLDME